MRKLCLMLLVAGLAVPSVALADRTERTAAGDGSLVVSDASGRLVVSGSGLLWGSVAHGTITVVGDYVPTDPTALPTVSGARLFLRGGNVVYAGSYMRFLFPSGRYTLIVDGVGIDFSAVGAGTFTAYGAETPDDGTYSADGARSQSIDLIDPTGVTFGSATAARTYPLPGVRLRSGSGNGNGSG